MIQATAMTPITDTEPPGTALQKPAQKKPIDDSLDREIRRAVLLLRLETTGKLRRTVRLRLRQNATRLRSPTRRGTGGRDHGVAIIVKQGGLITGRGARAHELDCRRS